jgi:ABC-type uncharacterized transport system involved in gliding motility auxiliary subunit
MIRRLADIIGYVGLAVLVASLALPFLRPEWHPFRGWIALAGALLVAASIVGRLDFSRRVTRYGLNALVLVVLVIGIIAFVEAVSYRHSARLDLTENRRNSLSPQTVQLLKGLKTDIVATAFYRSDQPGKKVAEDLLKQYAAASGGRFTWKMSDPDREPGLARRYSIESYGTVVLENKDRSEKVLDAEEEKLTNGLVKVTREGKRVVYVLKGHGEREIGNTDRPGLSEAKGALEKANYVVKDLALAQEPKIPDDAAVVIIAGPKNELFPPELDAVDAYLGKGGKLLVMVDSPLTTAVQDSGLKARLAKYGLEIGDDVIIELSPIGQLFGIREPLVPVVIDYDSGNPITREMGNTATVWPLTRTIQPAKTPPKGVTIQTLAKTSAQSWGESDRAALQRGEAKLDPQDPKGPLPVAAVATVDKARIVVFGTSNLAANQFLNVQGNRDFFLNAVSWLAEQEDQISIRPRDVKQTPVMLTSQQGQALFLLPVVVLPGLALVAAIGTFVRRRSAQ